jgi:hypothetical protein
MRVFSPFFRRIGYAARHVPLLPLDRPRVKAQVPAPGAPEDRRRLARRPLQSRALPGTRGHLVWGHDTGESVFGFKEGDQAEAFQRWADTCGIDWSIEPRAQPLPILIPPPERPPTYPSAASSSNAPSA